MNKNNPEEVKNNTHTRFGKYHWLFERMQKLENQNEYYYKTFESIVKFPSGDTREHSQYADEKALEALEEYK